MSKIRIIDPLKVPETYMKEIKPRQLFSRILTKSQHIHQFLKDIVYAAYALRVRMLSRYKSTQNWEMRKLIGTFFRRLFFKIEFIQRTKIKKNAFEIKSTLFRRHVSKRKKSCTN